MKDDCFTMLYWFLLYNNVIQLQIYIYPSHPTPIPIFNQLLSGHQEEDFPKVTREEWLKKCER